MLPRLRERTVARQTFVIHKERSRRAAGKSGVLSPDLSEKYRGQSCPLGVGHWTL